MKAFVAIDGDFALVSAERYPPAPWDPGEGAGRTNETDFDLKRRDSRTEPIYEMWRLNCRYIVSTKPMVQQMGQPRKASSDTPANANE
jgi:hypothetical protein